MTGTNGPGELAQASAKRFKGPATATLIPAALASRSCGKRPYGGHSAYSPRKRPSGLHTSWEGTLHSVVAAYLTGFVDSGIVYPEAS